MLEVAERHREQSFNVSRSPYLDMQSLPSYSMRDVFAVTFEAITSHTRSRASAGASRFSGNGLALFAGETLVVGSHGSHSWKLRVSAGRCVVRKHPALLARCGASCTASSCG